MNNNGIESNHEKHERKTPVTQAVQLAAVRGFVRAVADSCRLSDGQDVHYFVEQSERSV